MHKNRRCKRKKYLTLRFSNGSVNRFGECYVEESIINGSLELTNYIIGVGGSKKCKFSVELFRIIRKR